MIKITTDSTCDLPEALLREYDITVLPLGIVKGEGLFRDGVDIHPADIAAHVDAGGAITTTNAVNTADYLDCFSRLLKTCDAVVHVNLGSKISSCHQNARIAAAELSNVYVADSDNITVGMGELVCGRRGPPGPDTRRRRSLPSWRICAAGWRSASCWTGWTI